MHVATAQGSLCSGPALQPAVLSARSVFTGKPPPSCIGELVFVHHSTAVLLWSGMVSCPDLRMMGQLALSG